MIANFVIFAADYQADIEKLVDAIRTMTQCTLEAFSDASNLLRVPFPSTQALPSRFALDEDGSFLFMGQEKFQELHMHASQLRRPAETLSLVGTMGFGKSHTLAALVVLLLRQQWEGSSDVNVLYIPDCDEYVKRPFQTLLATAMLAFAPDAAAMARLCKCNSIRDITLFCQRRPKGSLLFVLDQAHILGEVCNASAQQYLWDASSNHGTITAVSINVPSVKALQIKDPSHNLQWLGGMSKVCSC